MACRIDVDEKEPLLSGSFSEEEVVPSSSYQVFNNIRKISCPVCQNTVEVSVEDAQTRRTVICPSCNEAVPIKNAPAGRKYVRCHCNALLVAKTTSSRVGCPRPTCAKEVNLMPDRAFFINVPELSRVVCTFCRRVFLCNTIYTNYPRCPHCRRLSSIDGEQSTSYGKKFLFGALLLFCLGVGVVVAIRSTEVGLCVLYVALFLAAIILALCGMYYCNLPTSRMIEYP